MNKPDERRLAQISNSLKVNVVGNTNGALCNNLTEKATQNKKLENIYGSRKI